MHGLEARRHGVQHGAYIGWKSSRLDVPQLGWFYGCPFRNILCGERLGRKRSAGVLGLRRCMQRRPDVHVQKHVDDQLRRQGDSATAARSATAQSFASQAATVAAAATAVATASTLSPHGSLDGAHQRHLLSEERPV